MLCYVMLCYVMLCYVMLCYVMLCYVMLCYVMLCYVMLCYVMLCYVMLCYVMLCYVMLCYVMLCYVMLCYVMLCYVMLCYVMLCYSAHSPVGLFSGRLHQVVRFLLECFSKMYLFYSLSYGEYHPLVYFCAAIFYGRFISLQSCQYLSRADARPNSRCDVSLVVLTRSF